MTARIGLIGARGHTGRELLRLIGGRDDMVLAYAGSREFAGKPVADMAPEIGGDLAFEALSPEDVGARPVDAVILALPNGAAAPFVAAIPAGTVIVDLSADYRFDDSWVYGLPEIHGREAIRHARRIANPGCYATAGQLAIAPLRGRLAGPAHVFGVSGYSGAGTTPSRKNDPDALADNLMPYALMGHIHEGEMSRHLGESVRFTPHVAQFFRGIVATVHVELAEPMDRDTLIGCFRDAYADEPLIEVVERIPEVRDGAGNPGAVIGGFAVDESGRRAVIVSALDNLLKGAATQAMQNLTLALGLEELRG
ncbi:N-acetyl-gamma-glutamyl-phosphate reductase [Maricaulis virginensis]|uniref:N-acetyl-gamma-glutamyl-phosphate reductase n=1 Tax=Maricaulis virginensis TaxID=144022 RepID=A0A9W6IMI2_9PROT|nr:N-acetyl-gamma-glutamyl-phosphate reductase [Maricaulis virginensis]GLK51905.1 N-acetyl-gamma-glutamyl-phosphate reductase [Maricaulis virginensis]